MSENVRNQQSLALKWATITVFVVSAGGMPAVADGPDATAFTYQGHLQGGGMPSDGTCKIEFSLWDDPTDTDADAMLGPALTKTVHLGAGRFNVTLDFGEYVFCGNARWLEIAICSPLPCSDFTMLTPRRELSHTAYALLPPGKNENPQAPRTLGDRSDHPRPPGLARHFWALRGNNGTTPEVDFLGTTDNAALELHVDGERALRLEPTVESPNIVGGSSSNIVAVGKVGATISGGGRDLSYNRVFSDYGTIGGGSNNQAGNDDPDTANGRAATVGGGTGNTAASPYATVAGGLSCTASGGRSFVGGGWGNTASGHGSTVVGGETNSATRLRSVVGGGFNNRADGQFSVAAGGKHNRVYGKFGKVGGGEDNIADGDWATISGGDGNSAAGDWSTVGGGVDNSASGMRSAVPGGGLNSAAGDYSFALGHRAKADHSGMFVWADSDNGAPGYAASEFPASTESNFTPAADQFLVRAHGGVVIVSDTDEDGNSASGVELAAGGGSWSSLSSRDAKANAIRVDGRDILERLRHLPIATWNYKTQDESIRHIGPMAQDFSAAFGVGEKETMITTIDADGVAFAAIQGLYEMVQEKEAEIAAMRAEMNHRLASLEKKLSALGVKAGE